MPRILIISASQFGAGASLATMIENELGTDAEVRIRRVPEVVFPHAIRQPVTDIEEIDTADLHWADGYLVISPTHTGMMAASLKAFIDQQHSNADKNEFANRTFAALTTATRPAGGQERVLEDLLTIAGTWGCLAVTPGGTQNRLGELNGSALGIPVLLRAGNIANIEETAETLYYFLERFLKITNATAPLIERAK